MTTDRDPTRFYLPPYQKVEDSRPFLFSYRYSSSAELLDFARTTSTGLLLDWGISLLGVDTLWRRGITGAGVRVAVLDTGIARHDDLDGAVDLAASCSFVGDPADLSDNVGHGTLVAGIIAGRNLGPRGVGVAPAATLVIYKIMNDNAGCDPGVIVRALTRALEAKVHIISISAGSFVSNLAVEQLIDEARARNIAVVCAAGNSGVKGVAFPAAYPNAIAVGGATIQKEHYPDSAVGTQIFISAPGEDICSTYLGNRYDSFSGTSFAAPFVSGCIALFFSKYRDFPLPNLLMMMAHKAFDMDVPNRDSRTGFGLIQPCSLF